MLVYQQWRKSNEAGEVKAVNAVFDVPISQWPNTIVEAITGKTIAVLLKEGW